MSAPKHSRRPRPGIDRAADPATRAGFVAELVALSAVTPVVFVVGPAGMGKSTLVSALGLSDRQVVLDGAELTATTVLAEMRRALDQGDAVVVDAWEHVDGDKAIVRWLSSDRDPAARLVVAGRSRPATALVAAAASGELAVREVPPLGAREAEDVLRARGVPAGRRSELARRADGNPLALQLLSVHHADDEPLALSAIIDRFVGDLSDGPERRALEALSFLPYANEEALLAIAAGTSANAFDWLRRQSFVRVTSTGLRVHEALADAVRRDLLWRRPASVGELVSRILGAVASSVARPGPALSSWGVHACLFLLAVSPFRARSPLSFGRSPLEPVTASLVAEAEALLAETYGDATAALLRGWLDDGVAVATFDTSGKMSGLSVHLSGRFEARADPLLVRLRKALPNDELAVLRVCAKRGAGFVRCDEVATMQSWTTEQNWPLRPDVPYVTVVEDPAPWREVMDRMGGVLRTDLATRVDGVLLTPHVNAFAGAATMVAPLVSFVGDVWPAPAVPSKPSSPHEDVPLEVLEEELRDALEALHDPHALGRSALATRLGEDAGALASRLEALVAETETMKPHGVVRRVLQAAYVEAHGTRDAAAEACAMSLATWKRYRKQGLQRLSERLVASRRDRARGGEP